MVVVIQTTLLVNYFNPTLCAGKDEIEHYGSSCDLYFCFFIGDYYIVRYYNHMLNRKKMR